ncbi:hypothetical protein BH10CYA1_BH10CYA1_39830 [soil metagenome]
MNWTKLQPHRLRLTILIMAASSMLFATPALSATLAPDALAQSDDEIAANPKDVSEEIDRLTRTALAKAVEIQKLNAQFRLESTRQPRGRAWRQFAYSEINASCTASGLAARMALSYPYTKTPATIYKWTTVSSKAAGKTSKQMVLQTSLAKGARPSGKFVEVAATTQMIGQIIAAAGDTFELSANIIRSIKARKSGFDAQTYGKRMAATTADLDSLLAERKHLLETSGALPSQELQIANAEGALLKDVRDLSLLQYKEYHSGAKRLQTFQNAAYLLNITKNVVGAAGNVVNLESTHLKQPKLAGTASLLTAIAGGVIVVTPIVGRVSGNLAGLIDRRTASKNFVESQKREANEFVKDRQHLSDLLAASSTRNTAERSIHAQIYDKEERLLIAQSANLSREQKLAKSTTMENVVFGTIVGSSRITQGVLGMVGAWHYYNKPWINARYTAAGATAYESGSIFNILETGRVRFTADRSSKKLRAQNLLPSQIVQKRLETLEEMDNLLSVVATIPEKTLTTNRDTLSQVESPESLLAK